MASQDVSTSVSAGPSAAKTQVNESKTWIPPEIQWRIWVEHGYTLPHMSEITFVKFTKTPAESPGGQASISCKYEGEVRAPELNVSPLSRYQATLQHKENIPLLYTHRQARGADRVNRQRRLDDDDEDEDESVEQLREYEKKERQDIQNEYDISRRTPYEQTLIEGSLNDPSPKQQTINGAKIFFLCGYLELSNEAVNWDHVSGMRWPMVSFAELHTTLVGFFTKKRDPGTIDDDEAATYADTFLSALGTKKSRAQALFVFISEVRRGDRQAEVPIRFLEVSEHNRTDIEGEIRHHQRATMWRTMGREAWARARRYPGQEVTRQVDELLRGRPGECQGLRRVR